MVKVYAFCETRKSVDIFLSQGYDIEGDDCSDDGLNVVTVQTEACQLRVYTQVRPLVPDISNCVVTAAGKSEREAEQLCDPDPP